MSEFKNLTLEVADGIAVLAISRPAENLIRFYRER